jgi:hypothetical protein
MLKSWFIKHFVISARALAAFLDRISKGFCLEQAFKGQGQISKTSIYRLYHRFRCNQVRIRSFLIRVKDPPVLNRIKDPVVQTILHLKAVFNDCMVSQFQQYFQATFL